MTSEHRLCMSCGRQLSRYNQERRCGACQVQNRHGAGQPLQVPPHIWLTSAMRRALNQWDWHYVLGTVSTTTGASQTQLATLTGLSQPHISRLISNTSQCYDIRTITQIVDGLGAPRLLAGLAPAFGDVPDSLHEDWLEEVSAINRRTVIATSLAAPFAGVLASLDTQVTIDSARRIRQVVPQLYTLDDQAGGDVVTDIATQCLRRVDTLLNDAAYTDSAGTELQLAYGELAEMTGWLHFDAGRFDHARYYLGESLRTAQLANDLNLEVLVLASMNLVARYQGRAREALQVIQLAQRRAAGWAPPGLPRYLPLVKVSPGPCWVMLPLPVTR